MPYDRPTLTELRQQVAEDIVTSAPVGGALLRRSVLGVLGDVQAGLAHLHYGYLDWIAKQAIPYTASDEFLEAWAGLVGVVRKAATVAEGTVRFNGVNGSDLPIGTEITRGDDVVFNVTTGGTVASGTVTVTVTALAAGQAGNTDIATTMTLSNAIAGIESTGAVITAIDGGTDTEDDDSFRARMLLRYQNPPQGGALSDYVEWALAVAGVTRAWCQPLGMGAGTVVVYFMMDDVQAAFDGFPQGADGVATAETRDTAATGDQLTVADAIFPLRPVTALVYCAAPTANPIAFTIALAGASAGLKADIEAAIADTFVREGSPLAGGTVALDKIEEAIIAVTGSSGFVITAPTANIPSVLGELPTVGTVTWT